MEWKRGSIIGRGSSAVVCVATTASGEVIAVKSAELSSSSLLQREQTILSQLNSPHLLNYLGYDTSFENNKHFYNIFTEYCSGGTLSDVIKRQGGWMDESLIRVYTNQILQGLDYLHSNSFVHCDIKGQNILVVGKDGEIVKIADLGCAMFLENGVPATSALAGTPVFMAPEVASGKEQGFPADIWALGCTIIEIATGSNPWPELDDPLSAIHKIGFSGDLPEFPKRLSDDAKDFLGKCLKRDAKQRWTAKQLLGHPFVGCGYEKVIRNSPTSVLELGFWDSMEEPKIRSGHDCPAEERIQRLIASAAEAAAALPKWRDDEDWLTVRSNVIENRDSGFIHVTTAFNQEETQDLLLVQINFYDYYNASTEFMLSTGAQLLIVSPTSNFDNQTFFLLETKVIYLLYFLVLVNKNIKCNFND